MTLNDAVLKSLEGIDGLTNYWEVCYYYKDEGYYYLVAALEVDIKNLF